MFEVAHFHTDFFFRDVIVLLHQLECLTVTNNCGIAFDRHFRNISFRVLRGKGKKSLWLLPPVGSYWVRNQFVQLGNCWLLQNRFELTPHYWLRIVVTLFLYNALGHFRGLRVDHFVRLMAGEVVVCVHVRFGAAQDLRHYLAASTWNWVLNQSLTRALIQHLLDLFESARDDSFHEDVLMGLAESAEFVTLLFDLFLEESCELFVHRRVGLVVRIEIDLFHEVR